MYFYKNNFSVRENLLPGYVNKHSEKLIYETNIINIFNDFKEFSILVIVLILMLLVVTIL